MSEKPVESLSESEAAAELKRLADADIIYQGPQRKKGAAGN